MKKKIFLQLFLFSFFLLIVWQVFKSYDSRDMLTEDNTVNNEIKSDIIKKEDKSNIKLDTKKSFENTISSLSYSTTDEEGNKYSIFAIEGMIDDLKPNIINMKGVEAKIEVLNQDTIYIYSDKAIFDNVNFNSNFTNNVRLVYLEHNLKGNKLKLDLDNKLVTLSDKVIYKNSNTKLIADYMILDLILKNSEISMYDKSKKVKIFQMN